MLTVTPACLGLLREHLRRRDLVAAERLGRGDELDREVVVVAGLLEQRLGLLDVLHALLEVGRAGVEAPVHVVGHDAQAAVGLVDHLLAVDDEPEGLAHAHVAVRLDVDAHGERAPRAGLGVEERETLGRLDDLGLALRQLGHRLDLAAVQRVDARRVVGELDHGEGVDVRERRPSSRRTRPT